MRGYYVGPVRLAPDVESERKNRLITIYKSEIYKAIDLLTHKHVDAHQDIGLQSANAVSSDSTEGVDLGVLSEFIQTRDALLRNTFQLSMEPATVESADNLISIEEPAFVYRFQVEDGFNDNTLKPLADLIQRYIVYGALYDWYGNMGMPQAEFYRLKLQGFDEQLDSILRGPSIAKRPMQPFGPQYKFE